MAIKFQVMRRFSGEVAFTTEIDADENTPTSIKLGLAVKWGLKNSANLYGANLRSADLCGANLYGANLRSADLYGANLRSADLYGANLRSANLRSADLCGANLYGANLCGADLYGANLRSANLYGANLGGGNWIVQGGVRSDGYVFHLQKLKDDKEPMVCAGCRFFTIPEAEAHWKATRANTPLGRETEWLVQTMIEIARIRGLMEPAASLAGAKQ